jgi:hypothetical protein
MKVKVSFVIQSHLSDAMIEISYAPKRVQQHLRFVRYLVHMFPDTDKRIDVDVVYKQFELGNK